MSTCWFTLTETNIDLYWQEFSEVMFWIFADVQCAYVVKLIWADTETDTNPGWSPACWSLRLWKLVIKSDELNDFLLSLFTSRRLLLCFWEE